jgi:DNA polymerase-1
MKACFIPEPGYVLIEADYGQLEFRLAAAYAQQQILIDIFNDPDRDVFGETAKALNISRQEAKTLVYTIQYGGGPARVAFVFGVSLEKAKEIINNFYKQYPNLKKIARYKQYEVEKTGKARLWSGRYRHFQYPKDESYKAFNSVVQGGAADIVERTMLRCDANGLNVDECRMLLQVHDSIVFEVREDLLSVYRPQIEYQMVTVIPDFGVKFKVDIHAFGE